MPLEMCVYTDWERGSAWERHPGLLRQPLLKFPFRVPHISFLLTHTHTSSSGSFLGSVTQRLTLATGNTKLHALLDQKFYSCNFTEPHPQEHGARIEDSASECQGEALQSAGTGHGLRESF